MPSNFFFFFAEENNPNESSSTMKCDSFRILLREFCQSKQKEKDEIPIDDSVEQSPINVISNLLPEDILKSFFDYEESTESNREVCHWIISLNLILIKFSFSQLNNVVEEFQQLQDIHKSTIKEFKEKTTIIRTENSTLQNQIHSLNDKIKQQQDMLTEFNSKITNSKNIVEELKVKTQSLSEISDQKYGNYYL